MSRRRAAPALAPLLPAGLSRPRPPAALGEEAADGYVGTFLPDPAVVEWIRAAFLAEDGPLYNPDHAHLQQAHLGVLWTDVGSRRHMRTILATAEIPLPQGGGWKKARQEAQLAAWFGWTRRDFLITLAAPRLAELDDASFCAVIDHELYHCAQAQDGYGAPRFNRETGRPIYALRGHDVEEFVGVVQRWGAEATGVTRIAAAAASAPTIAPAQIRGACGVCLERAA